MALFAEVIDLKEAVRAAFDTQLGAFQFQERRETGPAGLWPRPCAQLAGRVTFLAVRALFVIPEETHK